MNPKLPVPRDFLRWVLAKESIGDLQRRYGVSRSVIMRWMKEPEVTSLPGVPSEPAPARPPPRMEPLYATSAPDEPEPPPPRKPPAAPADPTQAAATIQAEAAGYASRVVAVLAEVMEDNGQPGAARIAAADKLVGYLPPAPSPKVPDAPIPATDVEFYEWQYREVRRQMESSTNAAAYMAGARRLESVYAALKAARMAEEKKGTSREGAFSTIVDMARRQPIGVVDELIARLTAVREERVPTAHA